MHHQTRMSTLEAALMIVVAVAGVLVLAAALVPIFGLIVDGAKLANALLSGDAATIGSLLPAAK
jgi:uncharacterized paraquat-inducible protein A